ncbi:MAG: biotin carboxylase N-terminal domain-containing protein, partial [Spirochaetales bacterium]
MPNRKAIQNKPTLKDTARIGIVNRGEAAVRFIRAVREFNRIQGTELQTVAFYTEKEQNALFSREADLSVPLYELPSFRKGSPYLNKELLLEGLTHAGCTAVWVGWGFVSEDADFASRVEEAGFVFLGPDSKAMALLGDKIAAKELAESNQVPICPWSKGAVPSLEAAKKIAEQIGYPVIVKAANAGGGRGIRFVHTPEELPAQFASAVEETFRITGNRVVFIERLVEKGRHLEVQVLADRYGNVKSFGVRDCSIQRKNQKIIEETPPPGLSKETLQQMEKAALRLIQAANYESAGTVEFLYDFKREEFYFMEVNTRLQVEHPITEQLYGIDLVQGQIRVARGESIADWNPLPRGVVIEARLNAEDPSRDFRPSPGFVSRFRPPAGPGIRIDSGIDQGSEIPPEFDSMVAKVIASGHDRITALARLERALSEMRIHIEGGTTNRAFLIGLLKNPDIRKGGVHTRFVEELLSSKTPIVPDPDWDIAITVGAIERYLERVQEEVANFTQQMLTFGSPRDLQRGTGYEVEVSAQGTRYTFLVKALDEETYLIRGDQTFSVKYQKKSNESLLRLGEKRYTIQIVERGDVLQVEVNGIPYELEFSLGGVVKSPSPGVVLSIPLTIGTEVEKGDIILTLEAMKMEVVVPSPGKGRIREIRVRSGEQVGAGQVLALLEASEEGETRQEKEEGKALDFSRLLRKDASSEWEVLRGRFRAVLLGYDGTPKVIDLYQDIKTFQLRHPSYCKAIQELFIEGLQAFATVERLFSSSQVDPEGELGPVPTIELLAHYFKRTVDRTKGFSSAFLRALERAFKWYGITLESETDLTRKVLFRLFKAKAALSAKQDLLLSILSTPQDLEGGAISDVLDEIALISQPTRGALAEAAINARYHLFDRFILQDIREQKSARVGRVLSLLQKGESLGRTTERLLDRILDLGEQAIPELLRIVKEDSSPLGSLALEALARRLNRDRDIISAKIEPLSACRVAKIKSRDQQEEIHTLVAFLEPSTLRSRLPVLFTETATEWVLYSDLKDASAFFGSFEQWLNDGQILPKEGFFPRLITLGGETSTGGMVYRTWRK